MAQKLESDGEALVANWRRLIRDLEVLGSDVAKLSEDSFVEGRERLSQEVKRVRAIAADLVAKADTESQVRREALVSLIREKPLTSVGTAFAAGLFFASLLTRRH